MILTQLAADNFNRANANPLSGNWTVNGATNSLNIVSNQVVVNNFVAGGLEIYNGIVWPDNQWSQCVNVHTDNTRDIAVGVRTSSIVFNGYFFINNPGGVGLQLGKLAAGVFTGLGSAVAAAADGDILAIAVKGNQLTGFKNGVSVATATDSTYASGSASIYMAAAAVTTILDNWAGGSVDEAMAGQVNPIMLG